MSNDNGRIYYEKNMIDAEAWFKKGNDYYLGDDETQDYALAFEWFGKAAEQGHLEAQYYLGSMYYDGSGVSKDDEKAMEWYHKAADKGHVQSMYNLGCAYLSGEGVAQNNEKAVQWLIMAARQGKAEAQYNLGHLYYHGGAGLEQDYEEAFVYISKAAEQGVAYAQFMLSLMYERGHGVPDNHEMSFHWCMKAIDNGCEEAKDFLNHMVNNGLTPDTVKNGMASVRKELGRQILGEKSNHEDGNGSDAIGRPYLANVDEMHSCLMNGMPEKALELTKNGVVTPANVLMLIYEEMKKKTRSKELIDEAYDCFQNGDFQSGSEKSRKAFETYPFGIENLMNSFAYAIANNTKLTITEQKINFTKEEHAYFLLHHCIYRIKRNSFNTELIEYIHEFCEALTSLSGDHKQLGIDDIPSQILFFSNAGIIQERLSETYKILLHGYEKCKEAGIELGDYDSLVALYNEASQIQDSSTQI